MYPDQKYPDLERLSDRSRVEAKTRRRGRLKIFLGYAAGVGKTFAMLEAAHRQKEEGVEVLIGWVETHALEETGALLKGLAVWPGRRIETRGKVLFELDVEGILARRPQLVLVDDLAHTNLPGGRHLKRFQDIEELLAAGIDVYTTIDVQYWESLNDIVFQITGVRVLETVPDRVFDRADEIELVDLPTEELIRRLAEGRIKHHNQAAGVKDALFRQGNLTALRELAMRQAAEHTDHQMRASMQSQATPGPWLAGERILVSLSSHPVGERLVRAGRKLADELKAEWFVLFVETADHLGMPPQNRIRINDNLALAERLGAHVVKASANSVAEEVLRFCQQHNITKIIAGRPRRPRWLEFLKPSVIEEIFQKSGRIDVFVVNESQDKPESKGLESWLPHRPLLRYLGSLGLVGAATIISIFIRSGINPVNLVMIYLAAVVLTAVFLGRGPSMLASLVSVAVFDFFIVNPRFSLAVDDTQYLITFAGLLIVGLVISNSATLLRNQVEALQLREMHAQVLNRFGQQLTSAVTLDQVLEITLQNFGIIFGGEIGILFAGETQLHQQAATAGYTLDEEEWSAAEWAFQNAQPSGKGTETHSSIQSRFIPLKTPEGVTGILGIQSQLSGGFLTQEQRTLLEGLTNLAALAIERAKFAQQVVQVETLRTAERLQSALLNSISHQLRTPLATITGVLTSLAESERAGTGNGKLALPVREELIDSATQQADTLNRLVENLLAMTRLESGIIHIKSQPGDVQDLVGAVINQMVGLIAKRTLAVDIPPELPTVSMDTVLTGQVLVNLLENSCKFSGANSAISISARQHGETVEIRVLDEGAGILPEDLPHVFDKFYRGRQLSGTAGTGLGLSICKGIIEAQGGKIWAENNLPRGTALVFTLPVYQDVKEVRK